MRQAWIQVEASDGKLGVSGAPFKFLLEFVKTLPGRKFDSSKNVWIIPNMTMFQIQVAARKSSLYVNGESFDEIEERLRMKENKILTLLKRGRK